MVLVSVLYPNKPGSRFDARYYVDRHIALVKQRWTEMGLADVRLLRGLGAPGGDPATYQVIALLTFESAEKLDQAIAAHGGEIFADIPNFTDVQPVVQVNETLS
jgi:uncharacterized protein (TIGR02118 family)